MDAGRCETALFLNRRSDRGIIRLSKYFRNQLGVSHLVENPWHKVTCQAVGTRQVDAELVSSERSALNTATTRATGDIQGVLFGCSDNTSTVPAECRIGVEYLSRASGWS